MLNIMNNNIQIVDYTDQYKAAFKKLNEEWISAFFEMEAEDHKILDNPERYILPNGGFILIALHNNVPAATCAMVKTDDTTYELCKMCVSSALHGQGIGYAICKAAIEKSKRLHAKRIWLETNNQLKAAIQLYEKLGFKRIPITESKYKRVETMMDLNLE